MLPGNRIPRCCTEFPGCTELRVGKVPSYLRKFTHRGQEVKAPAENRKSEVGADDLGQSMESTRLEENMRRFP